VKLGGQRQSGNVEDRRAGGGGRGRVALTGGSIIVVLIVSAITGINPLTLLGALSGAPAAPVERRSSAPADANDPGAVFVKQVLATTEDAWHAELPKLGTTYREPRLVLFRDQVSSACGYQSAAVGPFYCPPDQKAYLDLTFFDELRDRFGAAGDFAAGYVIAHEVGHHVQNLLGTSAKVRGNKDLGATGNAVRLELQADCYAGVWGAHVMKKGILEAGDIDEALRAAQAIGDDTLQKRARGRVSPESFSHGTSAQRARWFKRGMDSGDARQCDTFSASSL
jgi:uncharacterized protein